LIGFIDPSGATQPSPTTHFVRAVFAQDGWLMQHLGMEFRPQQFRMAIACADSMEQASPLLFEAGTGVGKSLAYLIPGILRSVSQNCKMVVASHTKTLQEQILRKDLQTCRKLFEQIPELQHFKTFRSAILMGKENYLCPQRLNRALSEQQTLFSNAARMDLHRILEWSKVTVTGLKHELNPPPNPDAWEWVHADAPLCNHKNCNASSCHYHRAKQEVEKAHVVILNHALLFALLGAGMRPQKGSNGILYPGDFVVLDEAHTVPDIATQHFGRSVSKAGANRLLSQIYNSRTHKGILARNPSEKAIQSVVEAQAACDEFFHHIDEVILKSKHSLRLQSPDWAENLTYLPLQKLAETLKSLQEKEQDESRCTELDYYQKRILSLRDNIHKVIALDDEHHVFWVERTGKRSNPTLRSAPLDIAPYLKESLFKRNTSCLLTSATLQDAKGMSRFANRCGASEVPNEAVDSPFDYPNRVSIHIATDCPNPQESPALHSQYIGDTTAFCCSRVSGGCLILFTNYNLLHRVAEQLRRDPRTEKRSILEQGKDQHPRAMVESFQNHGDAILLGTDSFWTGVDIPGQALTQVIITQLPFQNPSDPIYQARSEACLLAGKQPFQELSLPYAQLQFRQGIGRLIRNQSDRGVLTILDSRMLNKNYSQEFISILLHPNYQRFSRDDREHRFPPMNPYGSKP
jgi:ATP-dependent DNA helicase DinG